MKILQLIQKPQNRGAETFTCQLSKHLIQLGHEVQIIAIFSGKSKLDWDAEIKDIDGTASNRFLDYKAWKNLTKFIKDFQPDIIQANAGDTLKYAILSKKLFGWSTPIIVRNASEVGQYLKSGVQKKLNHFLYKNVSRVLSVSQASKKDIIHLFPFLRERTFVLPVGLESKIPKTIKLMPQEVKHIVHIGGFSFEKNHKGLLEIFQLVIQDEPYLHLHLVGDGPLRWEIETLVKEKGLQDSITFHGFVNNPLDFCKAADVLILPSIIEGLPGVLLEAMYCKTPVVAYNVGGIGEIVNEQTGYLIKKGDKNSFKKAILKVLANKPEHKIENAYKMVKESYMNSKIALEFEAVYKDLLK
ncbi:Glycosyltransferase involved in cell wall bisynthesis [Salegentibacter holothuriorum]|uniref:Glycosyltransferase involved in cell wall bisynthesis n=1 Tax=Salegentibacter holothuriorum TaxID=241145 RepID=A0A1T5APV2_9FLAO|nr:glycosyltransferase family 4 protein [Salegentibacter holothuriorum]SKB36830.1 Glycosyltransferase involved in cell wall bisynthesis [Salegentibacter holothuriorum]